LAKALDVPVTELLEDVSEEFAQAEKRRLEEQQHKHDSSTVDEN
jgi:hypothetical protein